MVHLLIKDTSLDGGDMIVVVLIQMFEYQAHIYVGADHFLVLARAWRVLSERKRFCKCKSKQMVSYYWRVKYDVLAGQKREFS